MHILIIHRPASYEVVVTHDNGREEAVRAIYRPKLGCYSPPVAEAEAFLARVLKDNPAAQIEHLSR